MRCLAVVESVTADGTDAVLPYRVYGISIALIPTLARHWFLAWPFSLLGLGVSTSVLATTWSA